MQTPGLEDTAETPTTGEKSERDESQLTPDEAKALKKLGETFVSAVKDDNLVAFQSLWLNIDEFQEFWKPRPERRQFARKYVELRDRAVKSLFPIYRRALIDIFGDLDAVQNVTKSAMPDRQEGRRVVSFFDVILTNANGVKVVVRIHGGIYANHTWHFVELPRGVLFVTDGGQERAVLIERVATADEAESLDAIRAELQKLKP
jgi:hypothetical protein